MMAVDTSVIVAIVREEPGHETYGNALIEQRSVMGAPTIVEIKMVLSSILDGSDVDRLLARLLEEMTLDAIDFTPAMADVAAVAFRAYGKGRGHPAQLNFGDCMSYAVAKVLGVPLLYKGEDFARTDIRSALS